MIVPYQLVGTLAIFMTMSFGFLKFGFHFRICKSCSLKIKPRSVRHTVNTKIGSSCITSLDEAIFATEVNLNPMVTELDISIQELRM